MQEGEDERGAELSEWETALKGQEAALSRRRVHLDLWEARLRARMEAMESSKKELARRHEEQAEELERLRIRIEGLEGDVAAARAERDTFAAVLASLRPRPPRVAAPPRLSRRTSSIRPDFFASDQGRGNTGNRSVGVVLKFGEKDLSCSRAALFRFMTRQMGGKPLRISWMGRDVPEDGTTLSSAGFPLNHDVALEVEISPDAPGPPSGRDSPAGGAFLLPGTPTSTPRGGAPVPALPGSEPSTPRGGRKKRRVLLRLVREDVEGSTVRDLFDLLADLRDGTPPLSVRFRGTALDSMDLKLKDAGIPSGEVTLDVEFENER